MTSETLKLGWPPQNSTNPEEGQLSETDLEDAGQCAMLLTKNNA